MDGHERRAIHRVTSAYERFHQAGTTVLIRLPFDVFCRVTGAGSVGVPLSSVHQLHRFRCGGGEAATGTSARYAAETNIPASHRDIRQVVLNARLVGYDELTRLRRRRGAFLTLSGANLSTR